MLSFPERVSPRFRRTIRGQDSYYPGSQARHWGPDRDLPFTPLSLSELPTYVVMSGVARSPILAHALVTVGGGAGHELSSISQELTYVLFAVAL